MKKIVVFGNQQIAIDCINILRKNKDVELVAVIGCETVKDLEQGYPSIRIYCEKNNITYFNPQKLDNKFLLQFKSLNPDICFGLMYRNFIKKEYLEISKMGFINIHPALLPKYRGPIPWVWAMLNGDEKMGITMHYMDDGIDTGDIVDQASLDVTDQTGFEVLHQLMEIGSKIFSKQLPQILSGQNKRIKQNHNRASYYGFYNSKIRYINWYASSNLIIRRIKALTKPYEGAISVLGDTEMIIWNAHIIEGFKEFLRGPGKIIKGNNDGSFVVTTIDGFLLVDDFEMAESRKIKEGDKFLI